MNVFTIDTLGTTENLKDSGFSESQAKAITESVREAQQQNLDVLATKGDLENWLENLEVCLSGFPLPEQGEDKLRWNDILKIILITLSFRAKRSTDQESRSAFTKLDFKQHLVLNLD